MAKRILGLERAEWWFWLKWVLVSAVGWAVAMAAGLAVGLAVDRAGDAGLAVGGSVGVAGAVGVTGAVGGAVVGTAQWLILRKRAQRSGWWVLASVVGWAVGLVVGVVVALVAGGVVGFAGAVGLAGAVAGAVYGAITAVVLVLLLRVRVELHDRNKQQTRYIDLPVSEVELRHVAIAVLHNGKAFSRPALAGILPQRKYNALAKEMVRRGLAHRLSGNRRVLSAAGRTVLRRVLEQ
jgi:hypothetical protein